MSQWVVGRRVAIEADDGAQLGLHALFERYRGYVRLRTLMSAQHQPSSRRVPLGPNGEVLTPDNLPAPQQRRWIAQRKAEVDTAVDCGLLTVDDACSRYGLALDEFLTWKRDFAKGGVSALRRACIQDDRTRRPERRIRVPTPL